MPPAGRATRPTTSKKTPASTEPKAFFPVFKGKFNASPGGYYGSARTAPTVHYHAGCDLPYPDGTSLVAVCKSKVKQIMRSGWAQNECDGGTLCLESLEDIPHLGIRRGMIFGYGHCGERAAVSEGQSVDGGAHIGAIGPCGHVHFYLKTSAGASASNDPYNSDGVTDPMPMLRALSSGGSVAGNGGSGNGGAPGSTAGGVTNTTSPTAAAFATFITLPGLFDTAESLALHGQKSLMNDKPLLPFIEQLCQASLRNFMSMPNGNFFAFYPDYFGGLDHRTPYWQIEDIEIIDGQIELSDDALATHVYVVGDLVQFDGVNIFDKIQSGGVVTVFNAFMADFLNGLPTAPTVTGKKDRKTGTKASSKKNDDQPYDPQRPNLANKQRALDFLQKYGARPYYEEAPMVRSPYYEAFLAYQKFCLLWSRQFLTTFTFTFMPELYPGGLVAFPEHGLQCYIDEVVHTCDYEQGFVTQANLSAPSALRDAHGKPVNERMQWVHTGMIRQFALGDNLPDASAYTPPKSKK